MRRNLIWFQFPGIDNVRCVFQGRAPEGGGDSMAGNISFSAGGKPAAARARDGLKRALSAKGMREWRECRQVHGDRIITEPDESALEADGMMSSAEGKGLMIKTADCQPILFASRDGRHIMAIHSGWRGSRMNFPGKAVKAFCDQYGLAPEDIFAVRGPSLGPAMAEFVNFDREWGPDFERWLDRESMRMDLWKLTQSQLAGAGLPERQIYGIDICTASNDNLFFSYRRDHGCGRQASVIWREGGAR